MRQPLVLSLFPGIGLLDMAFEQEGFCIVRGPDVIWGGDVRRFHPPAGKFDGVIGGPPCQAFSGLANLPHANQFGNLVPDFERCVSEAHPDWFVMENVPAAPMPLPIGYEVQSPLLNNRWLGEVQNRLRRISFGTRGGGTWFRIDASEQEATEWESCVTAAHAGARRAHANKATGGKIKHYTVERALELQGLPADFFARSPFTRAAQLKLVANGVPLPMGRAIARAVRHVMEYRDAA